MHPSVIDFGGLALATVLRNWMRSLRYECSFRNSCTDPADPSFAGPVIYIFWHEYIPFMFYLRGHCNIAMLTSQHRDAELLSRAAQIMGFDLVRGSSRRGGVGALRSLIRKGEGMNLTLTPDGPRGPRRQLAPGCLYLSAKLSIPLVPVGLGYDAPWRSRRSWDQFAIPRPWSRARAVIGSPIQIPYNIQRDETEPWRLKVQSALNQMTELAEHAAETNVQVGDARVAYRSAQTLKAYRTSAPRPAPSPRASHTTSPQSAAA